MPNRILRDWTDSEPVNSLDVNGEVFFTRLIMKVDDYGRFGANPKLLRSVLFPLKDGIRETDISRSLAACEKAGLIVLYSSKGKALLQIVNFKQRTRFESKYDPPPEKDRLETVERQSQDGIDEGVVEVEEVFEGEVVKAPDVDFQERWNALGEPIPKIAKWTPARASAFKARWEDKFFRDNWLQALEKVKNSSFCKGQNNRNWLADVDFFLSPTSFTKIVEGKYDNRKGVIDPVARKAKAEDEYAIQLARNYGLKT
jgi:hypothetical protein